MVDIPLEQIDSNPYQARQNYDDVPDLAGRILAARPAFPDTLGLMQLPRARRAGERYQLLFGHKRFLAFQQLFQQGQAEYGRMPLEITAATDEQMIDAVWRENTERSDLAGVEEATLMKSALATLGCNQAQLAERWGLARSTVTNKLGLLGLPAELQEANRRGALSERHLMRLAPLARLADHFEPGVRWSPSNGQFNPHAVPPHGPAAFFDWLAAADDGMTSDQVGDYVAGIIEYATGYLPPAVAAETFDLPGLVQPACKGCPRRQDDRCAGRACLTAKLAAWGAERARQNAVKFNLPYSDTPGHFAACRSYKDADKLLAMWQTTSCKHLVVGWLPGRDGYVINPFTNSTAYVYNLAEKAYRGDGRAGVTLGCTHDVADRKCLPDKAALAATDPLGAMKEEWTQQAEAQVKRLSKQGKAMARAALEEGLYAADRSALAFVVRSLKGRSYTPPDEAEALVGDLFELLWARLGGDSYAHQFYQTLSGMLRLLDVNPADLYGSADEALHDEAVRLLHYWLVCRNWSFYAERLKPHFEALLARLEQRAMGLPAPVLELRHYVEMGAAEIRTAAAKRAEKNAALAQAGEATL